jgi:hypothetical protein
VTVIDSAVIWRWACWPCGELGWTGNEDQALHLAAEHCIVVHRREPDDDIHVWGVHHFVRSH